MTRRPYIEDEWPRWKDILENVGNVLIYRPVSFRTARKILRHGFGFWMKIDGIPTWIGTYPLLCGEWDIELVKVDGFYYAAAPAAEVPKIKGVWSW